jgi:rhodanese-related sulfurtransferase
MGVLARQAGLLICLALLPGLVQAIYLRDKVAWTTEARAKDEIALEAALALGEDVLWVDARPDAEFEQDHIPSALPLNEDRFDELLVPVFEAWRPGKPVVVYCGQQECNASRAVAQRLRKEAGFDKVFVLKGGWNAWKERQ